MKAEKTLCLVGCVAQVELMSCMLAHTTQAVRAISTGVLTESRGSGGDAVYSRVDQLVEAGTGKAGAWDAAGLAPENEPPLTSAQDLVRQVWLLHAFLQNKQKDKFVLSGAHNKQEPLANKATHDASFLTLSTDCAFLLPRFTCSLLLMPK